MAIVIACDCGRKLQINDEFAGLDGQCPACNRTFLIPESSVPDSTRPLELPDPELAAPGRFPESEPLAASEPINNHGGAPQHPDADFFADPPPDIGPVLSANTTLRRSVEPWSTGGRTGLSVGVGSLGFLLGYFIVDAIDPFDSIWLVFWPLVCGVISGGIALVCTGFKHTCTYVGREGLARFTCTGNRDNVPGVEVFRFVDARELRTAQTRQHYHGVYAGTNYTYTWSDVNGRTRYLITGRHKSEEGTPPSTDPFQFARAAESAWTIFLLDETERALELSGTVQFNLTGGQCVRLGRGYLIVSTGGDGEQWDADEIGMVNVDQGVVRIKRRDAQEGWFSSAGVFRFSFDSLANAQLFFHLCAKLVGVPVA